MDSPQLSKATPPPWGTKPATFARFMEHCLYDAQSGYYRNRNRIFGKEGDFYTSPYTHPIFARLLARFVARRLQSLSDGPFQLVELGAGEGKLGNELLEWLRQDHPDILKDLDYIPVEIDAPALPPRIRGVVLSNEFFDALPVHRVRVRDGRLREIYVAFREGAFFEMEDEISDPKIEAFMRTGFPTWREDFVYEVNLRMGETLQELDQRIESADILTIDYGFVWREYDGQQRPDGTLLCYRRHRAHANPYIDVGRQDITAHVNFDVLLGTSAGLGWENGPLTTQRQFLMDLGLERMLLEEESRGWFSPDRIQDRLKLKQLLEPGGISDTMKALVQTVRAPRAKQVPTSHIHA